MARARNIKPKFFTNEELVELPFSTRLLFIGLWTIADRAGRLEDRPKKIKMEIFPSDNVDVDAALSELQDSGFVLRYVHGETRYIQILMFCKHQNPHKDEKASLIPAPKLHGATTVQPAIENSASPAITLIPDSLIPDSELKNNAAASRRDSFPEDFEEAYGAFPSRPGSSKKKALAAWTARLKAGVAADEMTAGVHRYAAYIQAMKTEPQYIQMPATFFGPNENFRSSWAIPQQPRAGPTYKTAADKSKEVADALTGRTKNDRNESTIIDIN
jgi:hypothetical protein